LLLDVNCELWRVKAGDKIVLTLATSLSGEVDDGTYKPSTEASLLDMASAIVAPQLDEAAELCFYL